MTTYQLITFQRLLPTLLILYDDERIDGTVTLDHEM